MKKLLKEKWMWLIYIIMFGSLILQRTYAFFSPSEQPYLYHQIMLIMSTNANAFPIAFVSTIGSLILGWFAIIFLWIYVLNQRAFSLPFMFLFLGARLIFDFFGHSYEWTAIRALYFQSPSQAWGEGLTLFFWILPSYIAMLDYMWKKIKNPRPTTEDR